MFVILFVVTPYIYVFFFSYISTLIFTSSLVFHFSVSLSYNHGLSDYVGLCKHEKSFPYISLDTGTVEGILKKEGNCGASKGIGGHSHPESSLDKNVMLLEQMSKENIVYFKKTEMLKLEAPNATFGDIY